MTDLTPFEFDGFDVRAELVDGEPWFVAADVAKILGYRMASDLTRRLDADDRGTRSVRTPSGEQEMTTISEAGLYTAILSSQVEGARRFKTWVTREVLPAIRKSGGYSAPGAALELDITNRDHMSLIITAGHAALTRAIDAEAKVAELEPAAEAWDSLAAPGDDFSVREAAQVLSRDELIGIGQNRLFGFLREIGWVDARNAPYQAQVDCGRLVRRITDYTDDFGQRFVKVQPRVTAKGIAELRKRLLPPESGLRAVPNLSA